MKKFVLVLVLGLLCLPAFDSRAQEAVTVRAGIHSQYNRLVVDWPVRVNYTIDRQGNQVSIRFDRNATARLQAALAVRTPLIRQLQQEQSGDRLVLSFQIPDQATLKPLRVGTKTVFDVTLARNITPRFSQPAPAPQKPAPSNKVEEPRKPPQEPTKKTPEELPKEARQESGQRESAAKILPPPPALTAAGNAQAVAGQSSAPRLKTLADRLAEMASQQASGGPVLPDSEEQARKEIDGTVIRLGPDEATRLAVFMRGNKLWLVLDKKLPDFMPKIEGELLPVLSKDARRIDHPRATAFILEAPKGEAQYAIRREKNEWQVWINAKDKTRLPEDMPVTVIQDTPDQTPRVALYAGEAPTILQMRDSQTGERLWIVPVRTPEGRIVHARNTPSYRFLPTMMGAALVLTDDHATLGASKDMVLVYGEEGRDVLLSSAADRQKGLKEARFLPLFRLDVAGIDDSGDDFLRHKQALQLRLSEEKADDRKAIHMLDLARLYIAQAYGQEALGYLRLALEQSPVLESDNSFLALRGMASALAANIQQAENDLRTDALQAQPAAKLWLGYAYARNQQWQSAYQAFLESGNSEASFPDRLQRLLVLAKAEAFLYADNPVRTGRELQKISDPAKLSPSERAAYDYITAALDMKLDRPDQAVPLLQELADGPDRLYGAKAQYDLVRHQVSAKQMELDKAIETLEGLRYSWRGDRLEIDILRQLGQYYIDNGQYDQGLAVWRQTAALAQDSDDIDAITHAMQATFNRLYVDGAARDMNPLQAVALFERFRELTPAGAQGRIALENLADRLAAVDLLDQADMLLGKQLDQENDPERKAAMGEKMARWRLLEGEPRRAIEILDRTAADITLSDDLAQARLLLRARALADTGQIDEALTLLRTSRHDPALGLRADINWRQNRWGEALDAMQALAVSYRDQGKTAIDGPLPPLVMRMAIALTLDGNIKGMELLAAQYGEFMATTPYAKSFAAMASPIGSGSLSDRETLKAQVGDVELFQQFLRESVQ